MHEGVPIALIEAMAAGVPIVASDCGAVRDIVDDGEQGYLVPVGDVDRFADRLRLLAGDPDLRARLGKAAPGPGRARIRYRADGACLRGTPDRTRRAGLNPHTPAAANARPTRPG